MFAQIIECLFAGIGIGFNAFFEAVRFYFQLNSIKIQIIAAALGISTLACSSIIFLFRFIKKCIKS